MDVPDGYAIDPATAIDEDVEVGEGETVSLDNEVLEARSTKIIDTGIPQLLVCVYPRWFDQFGFPLPIEFVECALVTGETISDMLARLGAVAGGETDANGDIILADLPAGCYYAVLADAGVVVTVEEFCLEPGETEVNQINIDLTPGVLDVFIGDAGFNEALTGILVFLKRFVDNVVIDFACTLDGEAQFVVPEGNYRVEATDTDSSGLYPCGTAGQFETQWVGKVYNVAEDSAEDGFVDDDVIAWFPNENRTNGSPDVIVLLEPLP